MTLSIPSANVSLLDRYDRSLASEGPELTRRPTFDGDIPPVEGINAGLTEELPVPGTKEERTCGTCREDTIDYTIIRSRRGSWIRCQNCVDFHNRMQRAFYKDEGLRKSWKDMPPSARKEWRKCRDAHMGLTVTDIAKAMALHIEKSRPPGTETQPGFKKCLRDSPELRRRYKGRAHQLKQVKSGATKVFDERRQCFLYEDYDYVGDNTNQEVVSPCRTRTYVKRAISLIRLKTKLDKAREAAHAAIAEDEHELVPPGVRQSLVQKNNELERMKTEIDLVANGDHSSLDAAGAQRKTRELVTTHKKTLMSFSRACKSIKES